MELPKVLEGPADQAAIPDPGNGSRANDPEGSMQEKSPETAVALPGQQSPVDGETGTVGAEGTESGPAGDAAAGKQEIEGGTSIGDAASAEPGTSAEVQAAGTVEHGSDEALQVQPNAVIEAPQALSAPAPERAPVDWTNDITELNLSVAFVQYMKSGTWIDLQSSGSAFTFPADVALEDIGKVQLKLEFALVSPEKGDVQPGDFFAVTLPEALQFPASLTGGSCESDGITVATFTIDRDANRITYTFTPEIADAVDIHGGCHLEFDLDKSKLNQAGETTVNIALQSDPSKTVSITFPAPSLPKGVTKVGRYDPQTGRITWTVTVGTETVGASLDGYTLADSLPASLSLVSVGIKTGGSVVPVPDKDDFAANGYTFQEGDVAPQTFEVVTQVAESVYTANAEETITNTAELKHGADAPPSPGAWTGTGTVTIPPVGIQKQGTQVDANTLRWEIKMNTGRPAALLREAVVTDQLAPDLTYQASSLKINGHSLPYEGIVAECSSANLLTIHMPQSIEGEYKITFDTLVARGAIPDVGGAPPEVQNQADMTWKLPFGSGATVSASSGSIGTNFGNVHVTKSSPAFDPKTGQITWSIHPTMRLTGYTQASITDEIPGVEQEFVDGSAVITYDGTALTPMELAAVLQKEDIAGGTRLTFTFDGTKFADLNLLTITYRTKALNYWRENNITHTYRNTAHLEVAAPGGNYTADGPASRQTANRLLDKSAEYIFNESENDGYMHYTLLVNRDRAALTNLGITDDIGAMVTEITDMNGSPVTGVVAPDWEMDLQKSYLENLSTGGKQTLEEIVQGGDAEYAADKKLSVWPNAVRSTDSYALHLYLRLGNKDALLGNDLKITTKNSASVRAGEISATDHRVSASSPKNDNNTIQNKLVTKSSAAHFTADESYLSWRVDINPNGAMLEDPTLTDTIPAGLEFDYGSISLTRSTHGTGGKINGAGSEAVPTKQYGVSIAGNSDGSSTMTVTLPQDGDSYTLQYHTLITGAVAGANAQNNVQLTAGKAAVSSAHSAQRVGNDAWGYLTRTTACRLLKYDGGVPDEEIPVAGAVYGLYDNTAATGTPLKTAMTDSEGKLAFRLLSLNQDYYIREISAPRGFQVDPAVYPFRSDIPASRLTEIDPVRVLEPRSTGDVSVRKVDAQNTVLGLSGVTFRLYTKEETPVQLGPDDGGYRYMGADDSAQPSAAGTNDGGYLHLYGLPWGEYFLVEQAAKPGYVPSAEARYKFTVGRDGTVEFDAASGFTQQGEIANAAIRFFVSKTDENGNPLLGAVFAVKTPGGATARDAFGREARWISTSKMHTVEALPAGEYTLVEEAAPDGYEPAGPIPFALSGDGTLTVRGTAVEGATIVVSNRPVIQPSQPDKEPLPPEDPPAEGDKSAGGVAGSGQPGDPPAGGNQISGDAAQSGQPMREKAPKTDDTAQVILWTLLCLLALAGLAYGIAHIRSRGKTAGR